MHCSQLLARLWLFPPQLLINAALGKKPVDSVMNIQIYLLHIIAYAALFTPGVSEAGAGGCRGGRGCGDLSRLPEERAGPHFQQR